MPIPDDEHFEVYLKQFRPLVPEPLAVLKPARQAWLLGASVATAVVILIMGALEPRIRFKRAFETKAVENTGNPEHLMNKGPLTIRTANALLAQAPSFKAAVDNMAFGSQNPAPTKGKKTAVAVLGKEKIKL